MLWTSVYVCSLFYLIKNKQTLRIIQTNKERKIAPLRIIIVRKLAMPSPTPSSLAYNNVSLLLLEMLSQQFYSPFAKKKRFSHHITPLRCLSNQLS